MIPESGMISMPLRDKNDKLTGKIKCMSWNDYKKCGFQWDENFTFIQDNTVKVVNGKTNLVEIN
jgi:hypothetical protein